MKRTMTVTCLALALLCSAAAANRSTGEIVLFDGPRGAWLGALREDAPLVVLEERDGWRRVRLEGWIMAPPGAGGASPPGGERLDPGTTEGAAPAAPRPGAILQGVLAPAIEAGGPAGAGVLVLLVRDGGGLEAEHERAGLECRGYLDRKDRDIEAARAEVVRALNSSDNFREAASRSDQAKARLAKAERERRQLIQECRARALAIFETAVAGRAISDGSGRFEFQGVGPGLYRVVAFETTGDGARSWSFSLPTDGDGRRVLDPVADRSRVPADWGLR